MALAGHKYEEDLVNKLLAVGLIPAGKEKPAGADDRIPDITIKNIRGQESGVEVKLTLRAAFGSGSLAFDYSAYWMKRDPWFIKEHDKYGDEVGEAQLMIAKMAREVRLEEKVNDKWFWNNRNSSKYVPYKIDQGLQLLKQKGINVSVSNTEQYETDKKFLEEKPEKGGIGPIPCPVQNIRSYYLSKKSYYIQIGDKGLYWLGGFDPLGLREGRRNTPMIPLFNPSECWFRVRVQYKTSSSYIFNYGLYTKGLENAPYSLGKNNGEGKSYAGLIDTPIDFLRT